MAKFHKIWSHWRRRNRVHLLSRDRDRNSSFLNSQSDQTLERKSMNLVHSPPYNVLNILLCQLLGTNGQKVKPLTYPLIHGLFITSSETRFGAISPLWLNFNIIWQFWNALISIFRCFELTLVIYVKRKTHYRASLSFSYKKI